MCVVTVKVKYRDSNSVYSTFPMLDKGWDVTLPGMLCQIQPYENFRKKDHKASVSVKTLTGEETYTSFAVDRLQVSRT